MKNVFTQHYIWLLSGMFFLLYFISGIFILDPDFGWSLRFGAIILKQGLPSQDLFSYSMSSYAFLDHEWITHALMAWLFPFFGMTGLAIVFALISTLTLVIATMNAPRLWRPIIFILLGLLLLNAVSVRPQVISFLFFACISQIVLYTKNWNRWKWFMPPMFILWANLHGGFVIGLGALGLNVLLRTFESKKVLWRDFFVVFLSAVATLINPYGLKLWEEVLLSVFDTRLRYTVNEWMPTFVTLEPTIWFFVAVVISYLIARHKEIDWKIKFLFCIFLFLGISSYRNISLFAIFAAAASTFGFEALRNTTLKSAAFRQRFITFHITFLKLLIVGAILYISTLHVANIKRNTEKENYPVKAIHYLQSHKPAGNLLSLYEWGGYLIWKYPEKKVFVDGRMPSWRQKVSKNSIESADASWEYLELFNFLKPFKPTLSRHNITAILVRTEMVTESKDMHKKKAEEIRKLKRQMDINNMEIVYQDEVSTLFVLK